MDLGQALLWGVRVWAWGFFAWLWVVITRGDWYYQQIKHRPLLFGLGAASLGYAALAINTLAGIWGKSAHFHYWGYYWAAGGHVFLCAFSGLGLWVFRVWPAGDAKLFMLLSILYPLLSAGFDPQRSFLMILINIFIPACLFLFAKAILYVFDTRLRHWRDSLARLGWRREWDFLRGQALQYAWDLRLDFSRRGSAIRAELAQQGLGPALSRVRGLLPQVGQWLTGMALACLISYYLHDFVRSPIMLSLVCLGLFLLWNQIRQALGPALSRLVFLGTLAGFMIWNPPQDWGRLAALLGNISVFSFFMFLGMNWAMSLMAGGSMGVGGFLFPLVASLLAMAVGQFWGYAAQGAGWAYRAASSALWSARGQGAEVGAGLAPAGASTIDSWRGGLYSGMVLTLAHLAFLGLFFGLALVLVRKWDEEVRPTHDGQGVSSRLLLAPDFIERLREDEEFFETHFQRLYPDGLTHEQAMALREWCAKNGIEKVPLAPTMSFAFWIFLGVFVSLCLRGGHVLEAVF